METWGDPSPKFFFIWDRRDTDYIVMNYGYVFDKIGMTKETEQIVVISREHVLQKIKIK